MRCLSRWLVFALPCLVAAAAPANAEKVDLSPAELRSTATHVVTGQVVAIYQREERRGDWSYTRYLAELQVDQCEKGEGISPSQLVYLRYWHRKWTGDGSPPPSTTGHRGLPQEKQFVRVYLARNAYDGYNKDNRDGGFNVVFANGFEPVPADEPVDKAVVAPADKPADASIAPIKAVEGLPFSNALERASSLAKPLVLETAEQAAKHLDQATLQKLTRQLDFNQQKLIVFAWKGSGQDKLAFEVLESFPEQVVFRYRPGRTRDLRPHVKAFAVRNNVKWRVAGRGN